MLHEYQSGCTFPELSPKHDAENLELSFDELGLQVRVPDTSHGRPRRQNNHFVFLLALDSAMRTGEEKGYETDNKLKKRHLCPSNESLFVNYPQKCL